jgi:hypothetical protein
MCTIGPLRFVGFLNAFHKNYPGIAVTVIEGVPGRLTELLVEGNLDVALMAQPQPFDRRLNAELIYAERFGIAFCTGHSLERRNTLHLSDVEGEPYLDRINCEFANHFDELCEARGIKIQVAYRSEREDWIMAMVAAGIGVCFAPEFSAMLPGICHRPIADPEVVRQVFRLFSSRAETFHQPSQRLPGQSAITIGAREPGAIAPIDPLDPMTMLTQFEWQQAGHPHFTADALRRGNSHASRPGGALGDACAFSLRYPAGGADRHRVKVA